MSNIISDAVDAVKTKVQEVKDNILLPQEQVMIRMGICRECPELIKLTNQCSKCGCFMLAKTKFTTSLCPLDKWPK